MDRCKICNRKYELTALSRFPKEGYCLVCEMEILICIIEMEEEPCCEEEEEEDELG